MPVLIGASNGEKLCPDGFSTQFFTRIPILTSILAHSTILRPPEPFLARVLSYFFSLLEEEPPFSLLLLLLLLTEAAAAFALVASTSPACFRHSFVCACAALMISSLAAASARKDSARSLAMASST